MSTRREALEAAFEAESADDTTAAQAAVSVSGGEETGAVAEEPAAAAPAEARARDEAGRFAPKQPDPAAVSGQPAAAPPALAAEPVAAAPEVKPRPAAPHSWKPEHRAKWDTLDPEIASYINQREEETARGVEPLKGVWKEVQPYLDQIRGRGMTPEYVVADLMRTYNTLANADPQTKAQTLRNIARAVGVDLSVEQQPQQQIDPSVAALQQQVQGIGQTVMSWHQQQQANQQAALNREIDQFRASHEHFDALQDTMARLMNAGEASDLDSAYTKAMRLHDDIWQRQQASQREADEAKRREEANRAAKAARANTVSTRTATPGSVAATAGVATGRRAALEEAFAQHTTGRL